MIEKIHKTPLGDIHYWTNEIRNGRQSLVLLPGLTADHRLFEKQIEAFCESCNILIWDAPGHGLSYPFELKFSLMDKAIWLEEILQSENIAEPIIIGQSMGGYVGQAYSERFPHRLKGFVAIDSAPLQRKFTNKPELWLLKHMEPVYYCYPWKLLLKAGSNGVATTEYGRNLMYEMMLTYDGDKRRYAKLSGHGFKILAEAMEADLEYKLPKSSLLICGEKDKAGHCIKSNKAWHKYTGIPLEWIVGAGHNSNTDCPERVNQLIEKVINW